MEKRKKKIFVAMSGGVDSSVAAALLKKQGHDITGVFMKLFDEAEPARAEKVAKKLGIPFEIFDFREDFRKKVIDYFLESFRIGETPNPCIICNKKIKFGLFLEKALALGADYISTGHYIKKSKIKNQNSKIIYKLWRAKDREKDQSYFLWTLTQEKLKKILFPMGDYTKKEVRKMAKNFSLPSAEAPESQEICFLANTNIHEYLRTRINPNGGKIITTKREVIGRHEGLAFYTIGQRKGIKVASKNPYYVVKKDIKNNTLIVSQNPEDLLSKDLIAKDVNWILGKEPKLPLKIRAKARYRSEAASATVAKILNSKSYILQFDKPQRAITPGQSVVFFQGEGVLGGGIIEK